MASRTDMRLVVDAKTDEIIMTSLALQKHYTRLKEQYENMRKPLTGELLRAYLVRERSMSHYQRKTHNGQTYYYYE